MKNNFPAMAKGQYEPRVSHISSPAPAKSTRSTSKTTDTSKWLHSRSSGRLQTSRLAPVITVHRVGSDELSQSPNAKTNSDDASSEESTHVPADASMLSVPDLIDVEEQSLNSSFGEQSMLIDDETIPLHKPKADKRSRVLSVDEVDAEAAMDISLAASSTNQDEPDEGDIADSPRGKRLRPQRAAKLPENRQRHMSSKAHADERFAATPPKSQRRVTLRPKPRKNSSSSDGDSSSGSSASEEPEPLPDEDEPENQQPQVICGDSPLPLNSRVIVEGLVGSKFAGIETEGVFAGMLLLGPRKYLCRNCFAMHYKEERT